MDIKIFVSGYNTFFKTCTLFKNYILKSKFVESEYGSDCIVECEYNNKKISIVFKQEYNDLGVISEENPNTINYYFTEDSSIFDSQVIQSIDKLNVNIVLFFINGESHIGFNNIENLALKYLNNNNKLVSSITTVSSKNNPNIFKHKNYTENFYSYFITGKNILGWTFDVNEHKFEYPKKYDICYYERPEYKLERDYFKNLIKNSKLRVNKISEINKEWKEGATGEYQYGDDILTKISGEYLDDSFYLFNKFYYDYVDSHMGICFENSFDDNVDFYMTEKTFKFLYYGIPFYNVSSKKMMNKLKEMGFFSYDMLIRDNENNKKSEDDFNTFLETYDTIDKIESLTKTHIHKFKKNMELINYYVNKENTYKKDLINFIFK